ncbi:DUF2989 domain-containing protein [Photobacterium sp. 2_MG-2023]|uniref:DUF2989 domain-containing protein n=1 Tax=Photobacterium sp. 2_MG-2023 TaxID=3062663 RepID=UPI0026E161C0|nr:DUF2989 domain-containing protein [Photobacterium sp. 2_MG-2023]MDO6579811.1 DUF2989 domain-containing protein [Photobacterium sp. 2_MG-2023]
MSNAPHMTSSGKKTRNILFFLSAVVFLPACQGEFKTTDSLCSAHPELCKGLNNNDGQCRIQRTDLIWQRYKQLKTPTDIEKLHTLEFTRSYQYCLEYAAEIEPTRYKERKSVRTAALIHSYEVMEQLSEELADSKEPEVIYDRWSQGEHQAKEEFLKLEGTGQLQTPELQLALASFYTGVDKAKTRQLLLRALELYQGKVKVKPDIILTLATQAHQDNNKTEAYLWSRVGSLMGLPVANSETLSRLYPMPQQDKSHLDSLADSIIQSISAGHFNRVYVEKNLISLPSQQPDQPPS